MRAIVVFRYRAEFFFVRCRQCCTIDERQRARARVRANMRMSPP